MPDEVKAARLIASLARSHRAAVKLEVKDILSKCTSKELDFYYRWCCRP